jgi:hypothetical protein
MRNLRRVTWTGIAAPVLMFLAFKIDYSPIDWLATPFWFSGVYVITHLIPSDPRRMFYAIVLNFGIVWVALFLISTLVARQIQKHREKA